LKQFSCPCETEIPISTVKQDLIGVADIGYDDPARWPVAFNSAIRDHIVSRGICAKINNEFVYRRDSNNRCFSNSMYYRKSAMGSPVCELDLCTRKVRIRLSAFVASYFLPVSRNLPWHQIAAATGSIFTNI
jgi:hypothetical protein